MHHSKASKTMRNDLKKIYKYILEIPCTKLQRRVHFEEGIIETNNAVGSNHFISKQTKHKQYEMLEINRRLENQANMMHNSGNLHKSDSHFSGSKSDSRCEFRNQFTYI